MPPRLLFSKFKSLMHERPEMLRLRAAVEAASGDVEGAKRDLNEALTLAPSNVNSLMNLGTLMWKMGQKDAARDTFTKILELDHHNRQALSSLGYLARDAGDTKLAESYLLACDCGASQRLRALPGSGRSLYGGTQVPTCRSELRERLPAHAGKCSGCCRRRERGDRSRTILTWPSAGWNARQKK